LVVEGGEVSIGKICAMIRGPLVDECTICEHINIQGEIYGEYTNVYTIRLALLHAAICVVWISVSGCF